MRDVYPGFLQLHGFMSMNLDRHIDAHRKLFLHLVEGDGDSAQKHREFYDEYLAVMDLAAEFYLQTVETVFVRHALPKGEMTHRGAASIRRRSAASPCSRSRARTTTFPASARPRRRIGSASTSRPTQGALLQPAVGHYGVFNGSRFAPRSCRASPISCFQQLRCRPQRREAFDQGQARFGGGQQLGSGDGCRSRAQSGR